MKKELLLAALLAAGGITGCAVLGTTDSEEAGQTPPLLRIGLLADTQLTSPKATSAYLFRRKFADLVSNVAVRTTVQEMFAGEHLGYLGADVAAQQPDLLLYLGDGANSGCDDELDPFFNRLGEIRRKAGRPVFFVVGNHDYLATGNQAAPSQRALACAQGGYATKAEIVTRAARFNRASWQLAAKDRRFVRYADSLEHVNAKAGKGCRSEEELQHERGCYYAGVIELNAEGKKLQLVLADTSDYSSVIVQPGLPRLDVAKFAGLRGGMGFGEGSQNQWIASALGNRKDVPTRVFASHYPTADLSWNVAGFRLSGRPGDLMLATGYNLWLSGHTHEPKPARLLPPGKFVGGGLPQPMHYDEINVGSTTDYRMHGAIVEVGSGMARKKPVLAMDEAAVADCKARIAAIELPETAARPYPGGWGDTALRLGLSKHYRRDGYDEGIARRNLTDFLAEPARAADRERWVRCLMHAGARAEHGWDWWMI